MSQKKRASATSSSSSSSSSKNEATAADPTSPPLPAPTTDVSRRRQKHDESPLGVVNGRVAKPAAAAATAARSTKRGGGNRLGMTSQAVRRLAQRGGLYRVHPSIYADSERFGEAALHATLRNAVALMWHEGHRTINVDHMLTALRYKGVHMHGYAERGAGSAAGPSGASRRRDRTAATT